MLTLTESLPAGALIGGEGRAMQAAVAATGGIWFSATPDALELAGDTIVGWRATSGSLVASAAAPNTGNSRFRPGPPAAMICEAGSHAGFMLPDFSPKVERFTAAVIYSSPRNEAKTLMAVRTGPSRNVIYLTESEGALHATDRENSFAVRISLSPLLKHEPRLAILSYTGRGIVLRSGGLTEAASGHAPEMDHPGQFLIGCRSTRSGLTKTLGTSWLHEVLFWPDRALLGSSDPADLAAIAGLDRYHRWAF